MLFFLTPLIVPKVGSPKNSARVIVCQHVTQNPRLNMNGCDFDFVFYFIFSSPVGVRTNGMYHTQKRWQKKREGPPQVKRPRLACATDG